MFKSDRKWYTYAECLRWNKNNEQKAMKCWNNQHWTEREVNAYEAKEAAKAQEARAKKEKEAAK